MTELLSDHFDVLMLIVLGGLVMSLSFVSTGSAPQVADESGKMTTGERRRYLAVKWGAAIIGVGIARLVLGGTHDGSAPNSPGGYVVKFPMQAVEEDRTQQSPVGPVTFHCAHCKDSGHDVINIAGYVDVGSNQGLNEQAFIGGMVVPLGNQLSEHPIELDGWHGQELAIKMRNSHHMTARVFVGESRTYIVMEAVPDSSWSSGRKSDFLDSFHLEKQ